MASIEVCSLDPELKTLVDKFRFRKDKNNAAIIMKINKNDLQVVLDEELEDCTMEELTDSLPEHQPRYVVYSFEYKHADGRLSYPMCFIFISPAGCKPEQQMMYAGSKTEVVKQTGMTKVFELRSVEELTEEWLIEKVKRLY